MATLEQDIKHLQLQAYYLNKYIIPDVFDADQMRSHDKRCECGESYQSPSWEREFRTIEDMQRLNLIERN